MRTLDRLLVFIGDRNGIVRITKKIYKILDEKQKMFSIILLVLMLISGFIESMSITLVYPLIEAIMLEDTWKEPWYANIICNIFHITEKKNYVVALLILLIFIFIVKNLYIIFQYNIQYSFIAKSRLYLQETLFESYMAKPYAFFMSVNSGEIIRIIFSDTVSAFLLLMQLLVFISETIVCIALGITIMLINSTIAMVLIFTLSIEFLVITMWIKPKMKKEGLLQRSELAEANKWTLQAVNGIKSIKVSNTSVFFLNKYVSHISKSVDAERKSQILGILPKMILEAVTITSVFLMLLIMILNGADLILVVPALSAFVVAAVRLLPSVGKMSAALNYISFYEGGLDNIISIVARGDISNTNSIETSSNINTVKDSEWHIKRELLLSNVSYSYPGMRNWVLKDAQLSIKRGEFIGIIGESGAGKTTTIDVLLGLLQPQKGKIFIDEKDIYSAIEDWHRILAYIPQEIFLMDDTIKRNIAFGKEDYEIDENKVWDVLRASQLDTFVRDLPLQLNESVGEKGLRLSGGQKQRIGIARALYNNPEILFFDEATSALDNETEKEIMKAIITLKGKKTLVVIAHRMSTISQCDVIYRVKNGKIIKEGKPCE